MNETERLAAEYLAWADAQAVDPAGYVRTEYRTWLRWLDTQSLTPDQAQAVLLAVVRKRTLVV